MRRIDAAVPGPAALSCTTESLVIGNFFWICGMAFAKRSAVVLPVCSA